MGDRGGQRPDGRYARGPRRLGLGGDQPRLQCFVVRHVQSRDQDVTKAVQRGWQGGGEQTVQMAAVRPDDMGFRSIEGIAPTEGDQPLVEGLVAVRQNAIQRSHQISLGPGAHGLDGEGVDVLDDDATSKGPRLVRDGRRNGLRCPCTPSRFNFRMASPTAVQSSRHREMPGRSKRASRQAASPSSLRRLKKRGGQRQPERSDRGQPEKQGHERGRQDGADEGRKQSGRHAELGESGAEAASIPPGGHPGRHNVARCRIDAPGRRPEGEDPLVHAGRAGRLVSGHRPSSPPHDPRAPPDSHQNTNPRVASIIRKVRADG